jgi:hypothetical protein
MLIMMIWSFRKFPDIGGIKKQRYTLGIRYMGVYFVKGHLRQHIHIMILAGIEEEDLQAAQGRGKNFITHK